MVAARRAAARIVDTLTAADRFAVLTFDHVVEHPPALGEGLAEATDRNRFRAVEHLATVDARGGTELLDPLKRGVACSTDAGRDRVAGTGHRRPGRQRGPDPGSGPLHGQYGSTPSASTRR